MIHVSQLRKQYDDLVALDDISFTIQKNEVIGFLGPNGAGKTTLMKILTCFFPPSSGTVSINGLDIHTNSLELRQNIGYLPEDNPLYEHMTVIEYLRFMAQLRKISPSILKSTLDKVIDQCHLSSVMTRPIHECSKGFKQRVGIAQAILHQPPLLILDEPTSGLDPNQMIEIRTLLQTLKESSTIIICSHILSEVMATCSRVFILHKGEIVANEDVAFLRKSKSKKIKLETDMPPKEFEISLKTCHKNIHIISYNATQHMYEYSIQSDFDCRNDLFTLITNSSYSIQEMATEKLSLEELFTQLTQESK